MNSHEPAPAVPDRLEVMAGIDLDNPELRHRLDHIAKRTADRLGQPIALVSMVLNNAQFFPGSYGLQGWLDELAGTPIEWSFCVNAVNSGTAYVVSDATTDVDQSTNPLVTIDGVRSYAGVPIVVNGAILGAHCVLGSDPRPFTDADLAELRRGADEISELLRSFALPG
ncbi:GAF domain-containing protein [Actinoplanes aureus]|uniref:GAF domain-containing protein n=1 Tax=Actinoplanes aureus TaxID=2792083 RepID=A0A931CJX9_9ACTN|nr:GAF domain-containing protein [Actinoplanes aureus]MBG0568733.1 GAF domain-containing protein [Actinoplanes aureus]